MSFVLYNRLSEFYVFLGSDQILAPAGIALNLSQPS